VRVQNIPSDHVDYFFEKYKVPMGKLDLSIVFFERALALLKPDGRAGFISSSQWMQTDYGGNLRKLLAGKGDLIEIVDFGSLPVFDASTYPAVFILGGSEVDRTRYVRIDSEEQLNVASIVAAERREVQVSKFGEAPWQFGLFTLTEHLAAAEMKYVEMSEVATAYYGIVTGANESFVLTKEEAMKLGLESDLLWPFVNQGNEVFRFDHVHPTSVVIYPYERGPKGEPQLMTPQHLEDNYPKIYAHLLKDREKLEARQDSRRYYATGDRWFCLVRPGDFNLIDERKLIVKGIDKRSIVGDIDGGTAFTGQNCVGVIMNDPSSVPKESYIYGLLNSRLIGYYLNNLVPPKLSDTFRYSSNNLNRVPIVRTGDGEVEKLVEDACAIARKRSSRSAEFRALVAAEFGVRWPVRLIDWWPLDFGEFMSKTSVRASLSKKAELMTLWESVRNDCLTYTDALRKIDRKIDLKVYNIYGLTRRQRSIVDEYFGVREI
jgi:TaqI-like C-terminal specificity domain